MQCSSRNLFPDVCYHLGIIHIVLLWGSGLQYTFCFTSSPNRISNADTDETLLIGIGDFCFSLCNQMQLKLFAWKELLTITRLELLALCCVNDLSNHSSGSNQFLL